LKKESENRLLSRFGDFSRFNAACANINLSDTSLFNNRADPLKVWIESSFIQVVGMTDIVANHGFFAANCTLF
jgi:hypothetical protein